MVYLQELYLDLRNPYGVMNNSTVLLQVCSRISGPVEPHLELSHKILCLLIVFQAFTWRLHSPSNTFSPSFVSCVAVATPEVSNLSASSGGVDANVSVCKLLFQPADVCNWAVDHRSTLLQSLSIRFQLLRILILLSTIPLDLHTTLLSSFWVP